MLLHHAAEGAIMMGDAFLETITGRDTEMIRVLVVDDDPALLETTGRLLVMRGFCPHLVDSGWKAVELAERNAYDVIVLDLWMPGRNGLETLERIRRHDRDAAVIATSGMSTACTAGACERMGVLRFLPKPVRAADLYEAVEAAAARTRAARESALDTDARRGSVLVADDHDAFRAALAHRLRMDGFHVEEASSGEETVAAWRRRPCNLALIDVHMPRGNGVWAAEEIHASHPGAPIAFMTGEATSRELGESSRHTAGVCLSKPLEFEKIGHTISLLIDVGERTRLRHFSYEQYQNLSGLSRSMLELKRRLQKARRTGQHRLLLALIAASALFAIPVLALVDRVQRDELEVSAGWSTRLPDRSSDRDDESSSRGAREEKAREFAELFLSGG
jgi:DNA-binding NtrC family response regulator